ncbi:hypothetical protein ACWV2X_08500 [Streptomyces hydrogenans]
MRRRSRAPVEEEAPDWAQEYRPEDWWVSDLDCPAAVGYGRICWWLAVQAWRRGEDSIPFRSPPVWWDSGDN